ncbi:hypothetical protein SMAC4_13673 [Sordaria macrospora]|uniref:uncharacterized protein n=1 Tax=Sordaria macrospora TaxID=5147 RepID=UPI002B2E9DE7|nr:hypothetical protein SMAC4_13673 [Sordaria macrospora]
MSGGQPWHNGFSGNKKAPQETVFQRWEIGRFSQIAMNKKGDVSVNFEIVLEEFSEKLKVLEPLCIKIRKILFPYDKDASVNIGTPAGESDQLYKPIIVAYDQAICEL